MRAPGLNMLVHTATIQSPTIAENNYGTDQVTGRTSVTGVRCRIQESSSNVAIDEDRFKAVKIARGCFPAGTAIAKLYRVIVTAGPGISANTTYNVTGTAFDSAGAGAMVIVDLERTES